MARQSWIAVMVVVVLSLMAVSLVGCSHQSSPAVRLPSSPASVPSPSPTPPYAPSNVTAGEVTQTSVRLQWIDNSDNEEGFRIYRDGMLIGTVSMNVVAYQDKDLRPATTYRYVVRAYNQAGESDDSYYTVRTLNPPIKVRLDRIGVYDNGESGFRDFDGGEVYVYVVITDGNTAVKQRFPSQEGKYLFLEDNETAEIGEIIFSTNEVGDSLTIAFVGYERDGGVFEQLVYKALGAAMESQIAGGTGSMLEAFEFSLGGLMAELFGAEDDWLGSYEKSRSSDNNWGIGRYDDIACEEEDGTLGLRLWFTVESQLEPLVSIETTTAAATPTPASAPTHVLTEDSFTLASFDEAAFKSKYQGGHPSQYPFNEYGFYCSEVFSLNGGDTFGILARSNTQICIENSSNNCEDGLVMIAFRRMSSEVIRSYAARVISSEVDNFGNTWEFTILFNAVETGSYQLSLVNKSVKSVSCEYVVFLNK